MEKKNDVTVVDELNVHKQIAKTIRGFAEEVEEKKGVPSEVNDEQLVELLDEFTTKAKGFIENGEELLPITVFASKWHTLNVMGMIFDSYATKTFAFKTAAFIAAMGHKLGAIAGVINVIDTRMKSLPLPEDGREDELSKYKQGDLAKDPEAIDAVMVTLTRPGHKPFTTVNPYKKETDGSVTWHEPKILDGDLTGVDLQDNLMLDWTKPEEAFGEDVITMALEAMRKDGTIE